jgi:hypothetical protein
MEHAVFHAPDTCHAVGLLQVRLLLREDQRCWRLCAGTRYATPRRRPCACNTIQSATGGDEASATRRHAVLQVDRRTSTFAAYTTVCKPTGAQPLPNHLWLRACEVPQAPQHAWMIQQPYHQPSRL